MAYFRSLGQLSDVGGSGGVPPTSTGSTRSLGVTKIHAATVFVSLIPPLIGEPHQGGPKRSAAQREDRPEGGEPSVNQSNKKDSTSVKKRKTLTFRNFYCNDVSS